MNPPPKPNPSSNSQPQPPPPPSSSSAPPPAPAPPHHPVQVPSSLPSSSALPNPSSSSSAAPQYPPPPPPAPALAPSASASTAETHLGPSKYPLDTFSWTELEEKFIARMNDFGQEERNIQEEFGNWVAVFTAWASVTSIWEEERGYKRLRTRISWVQNAEKNLEEKRLHYVTAIKAFENVVALLNGF